MEARQKQTSGIEKTLKSLIEKVEPFYWDVPKLKFDLRQAKVVDGKDGLKKYKMKQFPIKILIDVVKFVDNVTTIESNLDVCCVWN